MGYHRILFLLQFMITLIHTQSILQFDRNYVDIHDGNGLLGINVSMPNIYSTVRHFGVTPKGIISDFVSCWSKSPPEALIGLTANRFATTSSNVTWPLKDGVSFNSSCASLNISHDDPNFPTFEGPIHFQFYLRFSNETIKHNSWRIYFKVPQTTGTVYGEYATITIGVTPISLIDDPCILVDGAYTKTFTCTTSPTSPQPIGLVLTIGDKEFPLPSEYNQSNLILSGSTSLPCTPGLHNVTAHCKVELEFAAPTNVTSPGKVIDLYGDSTTGTEPDVTTTQSTTTRTSTVEIETTTLQPDLPNTTTESEPESTTNSETENPTTPVLESTKTESPTTPALEPTATTQPALTNPTTTEPQDRVVTTQNSASTLFVVSDNTMQPKNISTIGELQNVTVKTTDTASTTNNILDRQQPEIISLEDDGLESGSIAAIIILIILKIVDVAVALLLRHRYFKDNSDLTKVDRIIVIVLIPLIGHSMWVFYKLKAKEIEATT